MADILDMLMSLLCQQNTISQCQNFVQAYPTVWEQAIYFFLFPTVFTILFIYVISDAVAENISKKFKALIGIAIFVFIIMQGWYQYMLILSRFWFFSIIILGGFYAFMNMGIKKSDKFQGQGKGGVAPTVAKTVADYVKKRAVSAIREDEKSLNNRIEREKSAVETMEEKIDNYEKAGDKYAASNLRHMKALKMEEIETFMSQLNEMTSFEGTNIGKSKYLKGHKAWLQKHAKR
jgi:hypothetical protein